MGKRSDIIEKLKTWIESVTVANGYDTTILEVRRGIHSVDDMYNRPAVCLWNLHVERINGFGDTADRKMQVMIWGYIDVKHDSNGDMDYEPLDDFVSDIEKRIDASKSDWEVGTQDIDITEIVIYEGGTSDPIGMFEMTVEITYCYDRSDP